MDKTVTTNLLEREQDITETWANKLVRQDGSAALGYLRWPNKESASSQAATIRWGDFIVTDKGQILYQPSDRIDQVKL